MHRKQLILDQLVRKGQAVDIGGKPPFISYFI